MRGGFRAPGAPTAPRTAAPHLVQLGLVGLEVIGDAGTDLLGLPPQHLPEVGGLLALGEQCDLRLALPLVLVDLLGEEPAAGAGEVACGAPRAPRPRPRPALPGLGGAAQRGLAPAPHKEVEAVVQEENEPGGHRGEDSQETAESPMCPPHPRGPCRAAQWGLDPHSGRKVLAQPAFTTALQLEILGGPCQHSVPFTGPLCPLAAPPAHRGSSDVPFSATGSSLTFFFP